MKRTWIVFIFLILLSLAISNTSGQEECDSEGIVYIETTGDVGFLFPELSEFCASSNGFVSAIVTIENNFPSLYVGFIIEGGRVELEPQNDAAQVWKDLQVIPPQGILGESILRYKVTFTEANQDVLITTNMLSNRALVVNAIITAMNAWSVSGAVPATDIAQVLVSSGNAISTLDDIVDTIDCFSTEGVASFPSVGDWIDCGRSVNGLVQNQLFIALLQDISGQLGLQLSSAALEQIMGGFDLMVNVRDFILVVDNLNAGGVISVPYVLVPSSNVLDDQPIIETEEPDTQTEFGLFSDKITNYGPLGIWNCPENQYEIYGFETFADFEVVDTIRNSSPVDELLIEATTPDGTVLYSEVVYIFGQVDDDGQSYIRVRGIAWDVPIGTIITWYDGSSVAGFDYSNPIARGQINGCEDTSVRTPTISEMPEILTEASSLYSSNADWRPISYTFANGSVSSEMVLVPAGCFEMGSSQLDVQAALEQCNAEIGNCQEEWFQKETPTTNLCFDEPFWIDRYEVTN